MRVCPKPLNEQTFVELADCGYEQLSWLVRRIFESYLRVFLGPGDAELTDWGVFLGTFGGAVVLIARLLAQKQN